MSIKYTLDRSRITTMRNCYCTEFTVCVFGKHYDMGYNGYTEQEMFDKFAAMVEEDVERRIADGMCKA